MPSSTCPPVIAGATVLVTGAAREMGALYAFRAAQEGAAAIALWDADGAAVSAIAEQLRREGHRAHAFAVDVSRCADVILGAERMRAELGVPDIVINNSGITHAGKHSSGDISCDIERTMRESVLAPMWLTRELLPEMVGDRSRPKRILNIASCGAGAPSCPRASAYASSKQAMIGWSEALRIELNRGEHTHMAVTTFCPSETPEEGAQPADAQPPILTIERTVDAAWQGMLAGVPLVTKPWTVKLAAAARGVLPANAWNWVADQAFNLYAARERIAAHAAP